MAIQADRHREAAGRPPAIAPRPPFSALEGRYREYCRQQAIGLLALVPDDGVRPLYRRAREWATSLGVHESKDPMATLHRFCFELLPLPPFEVWLTDYETHRLAHLKGGCGLPHTGGPSEPVQVELREVEHESHLWQAALEVYRDLDAWRGYIRFHRGAGVSSVRTGDIFCDEDLQEIRDRFLTFTAATLAAFLRSILP